MIFKKKVKKYYNGGKIRKYQTGGLSNNEIPLSAYQYRDNIQYQQPIAPTIDSGTNFNDYFSGYDMSGSVANSYAIQPQQSANNLNLSGNTGYYIGAAGSALSGTIDAASDNPYNQQYGFQQSGVADAASSTPIGAAISGVGNLLGSVAESAGAVDYNQYGVNEAGDTSGQIYSAVGATLDPYSQLEKDITEGDWLSAAGTLLGGQTLTGIRQYNQEQELAKERENQARKLERQRMRALREQQGIGSVTYQPTLTYPNGGMVNNKGLVGYTQSGDPIYSNVKTSHRATFTPNELRSRTKVNTIESIINLGTPREEVKRLYKEDPEGYIKSIADQYPNKFKAEQNSLGEWTLSEYILNPNKKINFTNGGKMMKKYQIGGGVMSPNAELETDEVYRLPNGEIGEVPEGTPSHANGGVKMNLPEGTEILGKMKGKYNGKSYKDMGQDLKNRYDKYQKILDKSTSTLGVKTAQMMLDKIQREFDELWLDQEVQKSYNKYMGYTDEQVKASLARRSLIKTDLQGNVDTYDTDYTEPMYKKGGKIKKYQQGGMIQEPTNYVPMINEYGITENYYKDFLDTYNLGSPNYSTYDKPYYGDTNIELQQQLNKTTPWYSNIGTGLEYAAQFAPAAYNIGQGLFGNVDTLNYRDYLNPYRSRILSDVGNIDYNIKPELEANELAYQTARRNVRQLSPSTGALLSNYGALAGTRMRADAEAYARKQNVENQLRLQRAGTLGQLGAQEAQTRLSVDQINQQSQAAKQQFLSTGLDQLAGSVANLFKESNKKQSDAGLYSILDEYMSAYALGDLTDNQYKEIQRILSKKGK